MWTQPDPLPTLAQVGRPIVGHRLQQNRWVEDSDVHEIQSALAQSTDQKRDEKGFIHKIKALK